MAAGALIAWWRALDAAPGSMSRRERIALAIASVIGALSRFVAISRTPWDWDEAQFMSALGAFDVTLHHPHPPGFPLFIGAAKLLTAAGASPFRALQAVGVIASIAIVPAMFFVAREARATFAVALTSALLLAFFPNVWFYGGTAFSDVPAMVLVIAAMALLLRGCRSDVSLIAGATALAIAAGFRPQNLAIGALPFLVAVLQRRRAFTVVTAVLIAIAIVAVSYGVAIHLSGGWTPFRETLEIHQRYIARVDSFRSPDRPALWRVFDDFFIRPYRAPLINTIVTLFVAIGAALALTARRAGALVVLASFAPFCIFAWLILDRFSVSRFSIGYAPLIALLAAEGIFAIRWQRAAVAVSAVLVVMMIVWTWPALTVVRTTVSPPAAAIEYLRAHDSPASSVLDVQQLMKAFADAMLPEYARETVDKSIVQLVTFGSKRSEVFLREGASTVPGTLTFSRPPGRLWWLARQRYFDVTVFPVERPLFGSGWYDEETDGVRVWRWMGKRGTIVLPPSIRPSRMTMRAHIPQPASVRASFNGAPLGTFASDVAQTFHIAAHDQPGELAIDTDHVVRIPSDPRDLGVRLDAFELQFYLEPQRHPDLHPLAALHGR